MADPASERSDGARGLRDRLAERKFDVEQARRLGRDLCAALAPLHAGGGIHGSLVLEGVEERDGLFAIVDLGDGARGRRRVKGDPRVDVQAVGRILYQALTGAPPFEVPPDALPKDIQATVLRCLQRDPARRFASAAELGVALGGPPIEEAAARPRRRGWRLVAAVVAVAVVAAGAVLGWRAWQRAHAGSADDRSTAAQRGDGGVGPESTPHGIPPAATGRGGLYHTGLTLALNVTSTSNDPTRAWLARGVAEMFAIPLAENPHLNVIPPGAAPGAAPGLAAARQRGIALILNATITPQGDQLQLDIKLLDVPTGALRFAERSMIPTDAALLSEVEALAQKVSRIVSPPNTPLLPALRSLTTADIDAFHAYTDGLIAADRGLDDDALAAWGDARARDPAFYHPIARSAEVLPLRLPFDYLSDPSLDNHVRVPLAQVDLDAAVLAAVHAGEWGMLTLALLSAGLPADRLAALEKIRERYPWDAAHAAALAVAYRTAQRSADCAAEAQRALGIGAPPALTTTLGWCRFEAGDTDGALAAARAWQQADPSAGAALLGDLLVPLGRYADAREAYRSTDTVPGADWRLALVDLHARGRCQRLAALAARTPRPSSDGVLRSLDHEAIRAQVQGAIVCGDWAAARSAAIRPGTGGVAGFDLDDEDLLLAIAAARGESGTAAHLNGRLLITTWTAARLTSLFVASRVDAILDEVVSAVPRKPIPLEAYATVEPPLLLQVALAHADTGDPAAAAAACDKIVAAAPAYAPGLYCRGRVAEAAKDWKAAAAAYRDFLDRWTDADEENRLVRDARRRLKEVIRLTRAAAAPDGG